MGNYNNPPSFTLNKNKLSLNLPQNMQSLTLHHNYSPTHTTMNTMNTVNTFKVINKGNIEDEDEFIEYQQDPSRTRNESQSEQISVAPSHSMHSAMHYQRNKNLPSAASSTMPISVNSVISFSLEFKLNDKFIANANKHKFCDESPPFDKQQNCIYSEIRHKFKKKNKRHRVHQPFR